MTIKSMLSLSFAGMMAVAALPLVSGCLPEFDEAPLTATGEAPVDEETAASTSAGSGGGGGAAPACSGSFTGNLPGAAKFAGLIPCTLVGNVNMPQLSPAELTQVAGIQSIKGQLTLSTNAQLSQLKALTNVNRLFIQNWQDAKLDLPSRISVNQEIALTGGQQTTVTGFAGVTAVTTSVTIQSMPNVVTMTAFANLTSLSTLTISQMPALTKMASFGKLASATVIEVSQCQQLLDLPYWSKLTQLSSLRLVYLNKLAKLDAFPAVTVITGMELSNLDLVPTVSFPTLKSVTNFNVGSMALLNDLDGFGAQLQVTGSIAVCNILMKGADREVWKGKHAAGLNFINCGNGCVGWGTC